MSDDLLGRLGSLGDSLEPAMSDVRLDEVRGDVARQVVVQSSPSSEPGSSRRVRWRLVAAAAAVVMVVAGLVAVRNARSDTQSTGEPGQPALGETLVDQLAGRTWIAAEYPLPRLPVMRFGRGERSNQVTVDANDTCNASSGVMSFDGDTVYESQVMSTLAACGNPMVAPFVNGTIFDLVGDEVVVTATASFENRITRYVAVDGLPSWPTEDLPGEYLYGTTPVRITADDIIIEECGYPWVLDGSVVTFDASSCSLSSRGGRSGPWWTGPTSWTSLLVVDGRALIVEMGGDGYARLDPITPGTAGRPTLGAFLGTVHHRRWILDEPADVYPSGVRPFVQFAPYEAPDVVPTAYGFDGCSYVEAGRDEPKAGAWTPVDDGWAFYASETEALVPPADCAPELWLPFTGASYRLLGPRELEMVTVDGSTRLFRDAESLPNDDPSSNPPMLVVGRWTLDVDGSVIEFDEASGTVTGTVTFDGCTMSWAPTSDRTIGFADPRNCEDVADRSLLRFAQLSNAERAITVGLSDDRATMYLYTDHPLFTALRFIRVP